jgi:cobalt-zinc-cadmium efflux system protein
MLSDSVSLFLGFVAAILSLKKPTEKYGFGFRRVETIAAFLNGLALLIIPIFVLIEAFRRFVNQKEIIATDMLTVAIVGLIINIIVAIILSKGNKEENLNLKAAFLHVFADITSSFGVIIASLLILYFHFVWADAVVSIVVSIVIFIGGIKVTKEAIDTLMEATPEDINLDEIKKTILNIDGIVNITYLKCWSIASGENHLIVSLKIVPESQEQKILEQIRDILHEYDLHEAIEIEK